MVEGVNTFRMDCVPFSVSRLVFAFALLATFAGFSVAQEAPSANNAPLAPVNPNQIAVIVFQSAITQTNEFQRAFAELQRKYDPRREQLKALSEQIDTLAKQLQNDGGSLSELERTSRSRTIDEKKKKLERDSQDAQTDFEADMQDLGNRLAAKVGETISDYAQKHHYTLVLDASQQQSVPSVLYWSPSVDITKAIIDTYNAKSGIAAPPLPSGVSPKPPTSH